MAVQSERAAIKALADQRAGLEAEMEAVLSRLNAPGMPGVSGRLVDAEVRAKHSRSRRLCALGAQGLDTALLSCPQGFPRGDIDLHAVRNDRHRLAGAPLASRARAGQALSSPHSAQDGLQAPLRRAGALSARAARGCPRGRRSCLSIRLRAQAAASGR